MRGFVSGIALFCLAVACLAQAPSQVATFELEQPQKPYHSGDHITLKMTVTNVSKSDIAFEGGVAGGEFSMEWYDLRDNTSKLLAPPAGENAESTGSRAKKRLLDTIHPGESRKDKVVIIAGRELTPHSGLYKLIVGRPEWLSKVTIRSNPVTIEIVPK